MDKKLKISKLNGTTKDSLTDFNIVVNELNLPNIDLVDLPSHTWKEEDYEDVYFPQFIPLKAYDLSFKCTYTGALESGLTGLKTFVDYLRGMNDRQSCLILEYDKKTYKGAFLKSVGEVHYTTTNIEDILQFKITFRVTK